MGPEAKQNHHQQDASESQPEALASKQVGSAESSYGGQEKERPPYSRSRRGVKVGTWLPLAFNGLVMLFTGGLFYLTYRQLEVATDATEATKKAAEAAVRAAEVAEGQLEEMQNSSADTKAVADAAKAQALNTEKLALATQRQIELTQDAVAAAQSSARTADQTLLLTHRPWIWAKHEVSGSFFFAEDLGALLSFSETLENVGQSVAVDIVSWADLIPGIPAHNADYKDALAVRTKHCDALRRPRFPSPTGEVLFPKQEYPPALRVAGVRDDAVRKALSLAPGSFSGRIVFTLVGCISYRASFEAVDARRHQTRFLYTLASLSSGGGWVLLKPSGSISGLVLVLVPEANAAD